MILLSQIKEGRRERGRKGEREKESREGWRDRDREGWEMDSRYNLKNP